jgi:hypothetical protein
VKKPLVAVLGLSLAFAVCFAAGCTAGPNVFKNSPGANGSVAGFWLGLWHGFILPFAFVVSLFNDKVSIYGCTTQAPCTTSAFSSVPR